METIYRGFLVVHVGLGLVALGLFWAALVQRKGSARHRRLGRAFVGTLWGTLATALVLSGLATAWPLLLDPAEPSVGNAALARHAAEARDFALLLGALAVGTGGALFVGDRAVRGPRARGVRTPALDVAVTGMLIAIGAVGLVASVFGSGIVLLVGGFAGLVLVGPQSRRRRLRDHLIGILWAGTAAHSAFAISVVPRLIPGIYARDPAVEAAPWVLPPLVGFVGILLAVRRWAPLRRSKSGLASTLVGEA